MGQIKNSKKLTERKYAKYKNSSNVCYNKHVVKIKNVKKRKNVT